MNPFLMGGLGLLGLGGGFLGGRGRKPIDPEMLARLFGPNALAGDTQALYQTLAASPMFSQIMASASSMGTQAGNASNAAFARAGLGTSGIGAVGQAVSSQFGNNLMLRARGNLWAQALQAAQQSLSQRAGIWGQSQAQYQQTPTMAQQFGAGLTGLASTGFQAMMAPKAPVNNYYGYAPETSVVTAPMRRFGSQSTGMYGWRGM